MSAGSGIGKRRSAAKEDATRSYQIRRKEIAGAAVRVFNRLGFQRASISAVAAELGIDRASLYYYISSKEELFDQVVREVVERNAAIARRIRESDLSPLEKVRAIIVALMASYGDNYPLIYIYIRENLSHVSKKRSAWSKHMRKLNHEIEDAMIWMIQQGYTDGTLRDIGQPRIVVYGLLGTIGWTHRWFRPEKSDLSAEQIGTMNADMLLGGLQMR